MHRSVWWTCLSAKPGWVKLKDENVKVKACANKWQKFALIQLSESGLFVRFFASELFFVVNSCGFFQKNNIFATDNGVTADNVGVLVKGNPV